MRPGETWYERADACIVLILFLLVFGGMLVESPSNGKRRAGRESWPIVSGLGRGKTRRNNLTEALVLLSARASYDYSDFGPTDRYSSKGGAG